MSNKYYTIFKEIIPTTMVNMSIIANFIDEQETNLIIIKNNYLEVYGINPEDSKLLLLNSYELFGIIESIEKIRLSNNKRDSIILTFKDAKVSIVEHDEKKNTLKTCCLYYLEDETKKEGCLEFNINPIIKVDPKYRCSGLIIYDTKLAIIPFNNEFLERENEEKFQRNFIKDLENIKNIKDYNFLDGYFDPTIAILYESEPTTSSRVFLKKNSMSLTAISIDATKKFPVILNLQNLSYDLYKIIPLERGAFLIIGYNQIIHVNQRILCGITLNDYAYVGSTKLDYIHNFEKSELNVIFDVSSYDFLSENTILFTLKGGDVYNLQILNEKNIKLSKIDDIIIEGSCMSILREKNLVFIGSRLEDSILLRYINKSEEIEKSEKEIIKKELEDIIDDELEGIFEENDDEPKKKKPKLNKFYEFLESDLKEDYEKSYIQYSFTKIDSLATLGPFPNFQISKLNNKSKIITQTGYQKSGSILIIEKSIKPIDFITQDLTFENIFKLFTLKLIESEYDSFVVVSRSDSTKILKVEEGLYEVTDTKFILNEQTLNIGYFNTNIIQILKSKIRVLKNISTLIEDIDLDREIYSSVIQNQLILLHYNDGLISFIISSNKFYTPKFNHSFGKILATSLFYYKSENIYQLIIYWSSGVLEIYSIENNFESDTLEMENIFTYLNFSNLPDYIYNQKINKEEIEEFNSTVVHYPYVKEILMKRFSVFNYLFFIMSDGNLLIYKEFKNLNFSKVSHNFLYKNFEKATESNNEDFEKSKDNFKEKYNNSEKNNEFEINIDKNKDNIQNFNLEKENKKYDYENIDLNSNSIFLSPLNSILIPFNNISGLSGIFLCIPSHPSFIFSYRSDIKIHSIDVDSADDKKYSNILTFTPFFNELCKNGFIYLTKSKFCISNLESNYNFDYYFPYKRYNIGVTPKYIIHHNNMYIVAYSRQVDLQLPEELEESEIKYPSNGRYPIFKQEQHEIMMLNQDFKKTSFFEFAPYENIIEMKKVNLEKEDNNYNTLIAIGTGLKIKILNFYLGTVISEETGCKGRILLFSVEQYGNRDIYTLDKISEKELKNPATAISEIDGWLLVAVGFIKKFIFRSKINIYYFDWNAKQLIPASFFDSQLYVTSISTIKRYILYGDELKSVYFINWKKNKGRSLNLLAKDFEPLNVTSTGNNIIIVGFIVWENLLGLLVSDKNKNLQIYSYSPKKIDSYRGKKLIVESDIHIGSEISCFIRVQMKNKQNSQQSFFSTLDGQIGSIQPISENSNRILSSLCSKLLTFIPHYAGLHPKAFRLFKYDHRFQRNIKKNIIDGQLLWKFLSLNAIQQKELAKQIGTTVSTINSHILDIENNLNIF